MRFEPITLAAVVTGVLLLLALVVWGARRQSRARSAALQDHFGPEYERALAEHGDRARAERELLARKKRFDKLDIKLLSPEQCARFGEEWAAVQQRFVDEPSRAVTEAHRLVKDVMRARGYPMGDFEQRVADLSVEHAHVVDHYRAARALATANESGAARTEDLRQAMVHYRALFTALLESREPHAPLRPARA